MNEVSESGPALPDVVLKGECRLTAHHTVNRRVDLAFVGFCRSPIHQTHRATSNAPAPKKTYNTRQKPKRSAKVQHQAQDDSSTTTTTSSKPAAGGGGRRGTSTVPSPSPLRMAYSQPNSPEEPDEDGTKSKSLLSIIKEESSRPARAMSESGLPEAAGSSSSLTTTTTTTTGRKRRRGSGIEESELADLGSKKQAVRVSPRLAHATPNLSAGQQPTNHDRDASTTSSSSTTTIPTKNQPSEDLSNHHDKPFKSSCTDKTDLGKMLLKREVERKKRAQSHSPPRSERETVGATAAGVNAPSLSSNGQTGAGGRLASTRTPIKSWKAQQQLSEGPESFTTSEEPPTDSTTPPTFHKRVGLSNRRTVSHDHLTFSTTTMPSPGSTDLATTTTQEDDMTTTSDRSAPDSNRVVSLKMAA